MAKKILGRILPMLLAMCILLSTTAYAATTYYIDVTLTGPDANGVTQTISGQSSKYGSMASPLTFEVVQVLNSKLDTIETVFAKTGLRQIVYDGLEAFTDGEDAWDAYGDIHDDDVTGDIKDALYDLDSTFAELTLNEANELTYLSDKGTVYVVTITLREYKTGSGDGECPRDDTCPAAYLTDLYLEQWYHEGIHYCVEHGLMAGYPGNLFGPQDDLTRAHVVQVLYNREGRPAVTGKKVFHDVPVSDWYADAVEWASQAGVVFGYGDGIFGPTDSITREQLATMLYRYSQYKGYDVSSGENVDFLIFSDADSVSDWALSAIKWAYAEDIILGMGDGTLEPASHATRAQSATVFMRYCMNTAN